MNQIFMQMNSFQKDEKDEMILHHSNGFQSHYSATSIESYEHDLNIAPDLILRNQEQILLYLKQCIDDLPCDASVPVNRFIARVIDRLCLPSHFQPNAIPVFDKAMGTFILVENKAKKVPKKELLLPNVLTFLQTQATHKKTLKNIAKNKFYQTVLIQKQINQRVTKFLIVAFFSHLLFFTYIYYVG